MMRIDPVSRGFTLLELLVVIVLVVVFVIAALENLLPLRGEAERAMVSSTVGNLKSAIGLEASERVVRHGPGSLRSMNSANPMHWLGVTPTSYAGERGDITYDAAAPGSWTFFPDTGTLFYRVRHPAYFEGNFRTPPGIRYRVTVSEGADGQPVSLRLEQLDAAEWNTSGSEIRRWLEMIR